jgi:hypothetical protein
MRHSQEVASHRDLISNYKTGITARRATQFNRQWPPKLYDTGTRYCSLQQNTQHCLSLYWSVPASFVTTILRGLSAATEQELPQDLVYAQQSLEVGDEVYTVTILATTVELEN